MKRPGESQNPITKITQIFQRADGSEARITAQSMHGSVLDDALSLVVHRRSGPDEPWQLCSDQPHPDWRSMSVDEYKQRGRPEHLQAVSFAEIVKTTRMLGRDLDEMVAQGAVARAPGDIPGPGRDAPIAEHVEHYLQAVRSEIEPAVFLEGQHHALASTLQGVFGGDLVAVIRRATADAGTKWMATACKSDGQHFDIYGAWNIEPYLTDEFELVAIDGAEMGAFIKQHDGQPFDQELAAKLRAIGRREIQVMVELAEQGVDEQVEQGPEL